MHESRSSGLPSSQEGRAPVCGVGHVDVRLDAQVKAARHDGLGRAAQLKRADVAEQSDQHAPEMVQSARTSTVRPAGTEVS